MQFLYYQQKNLQKDTIRKIEIVDYKEIFPDVSSKNMLKYSPEVSDPPKLIQDFHAFLRSIQTKISEEEKQKDPLVKKEPRHEGEFRDMVFSPEHSLQFPRPS